MKKALIVAGIFIACSAGVAHAGGYSVSNEGQVAVYRGHAPTVDPYALQAYYHQQEADEKARRLKAKIRVQKRELRQQAEELERLAARTARLEEQARRRPRYGRSYYGNSRFFGVNGFVGNRFYSGGTVLNVRRRY